MTSRDNNATARILLVDNEPDNTSVLSMGLEDEGYKVDAFNDPVVALHNFRPNWYSLALLDINMPIMNGYDLWGWRFTDIFGKKAIRQIESMNSSKENTKIEVKLRYRRYLCSC